MQVESGKIKTMKVRSEVKKVSVSGLFTFKISQSERGTSLFDGTEHVQTLMGVKSKYFRAIKGLK